MSLSCLLCISGNSKQICFCAYYGPSKYILILCKQQCGNIGYNPFSIYKYNIHYTEYLAFLAMSERYVGLIILLFFVHKDPSNLSTILPVYLRRTVYTVQYKVHCTVNCTLYTVPSRKFKRISNKNKISTKST